MSLTLPKKNLILGFSIILLVIISGLRPVGLDNDSHNYVQILNVGLENANFLDKEPFFWLISEFNNLFFSGKTVTFFLIFASIGVFFKWVAIQKISKAPYLSLVSYVLFYFILHEMTQIRTGVAAGLFLLAINDYYNKNMRHYFCKVAIACLFHYSAVLALLLLILKRDSFNPIMYTSVLFLSLVFAFLIEDNFLAPILPFLPDFLSSKILIYLALFEEGRFSEINKVNIYYLSLFAASVFFAWNYQRIKDGLDLFLLKIFIMGIASFYFLSFLPVLAFRVSEFYLVVIILLLANLSLYFKQKNLYIAAVLSFGLVIFISQGVLKNLNFEVLF